jgi:hypothetical protein
MGYLSMASAYRTVPTDSGGRVNGWVGYVPRRIFNTAADHSLTGDSCGTLHVAIPTTFIKPPPGDIRHHGAPDRG